MKKNDVLIPPFSSLVDLRLRGFERSVPAGRVVQLAFEEVSAQTWFDRFVEQVHSAMGRRFFPVYRMADGEFIFCVGRKPALPPRHVHGLWAALWRLRAQISVLRNYRRNATCWGEQYEGVDPQRLMAHYCRCLEKVANSGMLALHFVRSPSRFSEQYIAPMLDWFAQHQIALTPENYTSFYFVYAMLCGPESNRLLAGRNVLIVTHADHDKREKLTHALKARGADSVQFLLASANRALMDQLDLKRVKSPVDLVLVAGGIGSVNLLAQLEPLQTACIDAGICMEILTNGTMRGRVFTQPDGC